ncbi:MAG: hypothetical protein IJ360_03840 [Clostridia bacterium]|nr:hypothetical protein [Clostridia bacterium]
MFTNKNKLIGFIALIVVVVLVASAAIALIADSSTKKALADAQAKIEELESALNGADADLDKAEKALADLKAQLSAANGKLDVLEGLTEKYEELISSWTATTPAIRAFIQEEINPVYDEMLAAINSGYVDGVSAEDVLNEKMDLVIWALRSADLTAVRAELEKNEEEFNDLRLDLTLDAMIEEVKKDGVTYDPDDKPGIDACEDYLANHPVLQNNATKDYEGQIAELKAQYDAAKKAYFAEKFIAEVAKVDPAVDGNTYVTLDTDTTAVKAAWDELVAVCADEAEALALTGVQAAHDVWTKVEARLVVLANAKVAADDLNAKIAGVTVEATVATGNIIAQLKADVAAWGTTYAIDKTLEPLNWFVNDDAFAALDAAYAEKIAELKALHDALLEALKAEDFVHITINSEEAVKAAEDAYNAVAKYQDVEALVDCNGTMAEHKAAIDAAKALLAEKLALVNEIRALIDAMEQAGYTEVLVSVLEQNIAVIDAKVALFLQGADNVIEHLNTADKNYVEALESVRLYDNRAKALDMIETVQNEYFPVNVYDAASQLRTLVDTAATEADIDKWAVKENVENYYDTFLAEK